MGGGLASIAPSVLAARPRRSPPHARYGATGQEVARIEKTVTVSSSGRGKYHEEAQFCKGKNSRSSDRRRLREIYRKGKNAPAGRYERLRRHKGPGLGRSLQSFELRLITKLADHKISLFRRLNSSANRHVDRRCRALAAVAHSRLIAIRSWS